MKLYILEISGDQKEITVVRSERLLYNLVCHDIEILDIVRKLFPDYRVYEIDEKHFREAVTTKEMLNPIL